MATDNPYPDPDDPPVNGDTSVVLRPGDKCYLITSKWGPEAICMTPDGAKRVQETLLTHLAYRNKDAAIRVHEMEVEE